MIATPNPTMVELPPALAAQGLTLRHWHDDADFSSMAFVLTASCASDGLSKEANGDGLRRMFADIAHFEPGRDLFLLSNPFGLIGYADCRRKETTDKQYPYRIRLYVLPEWRGQGIENELLQVGQEHLRPYADLVRQDITHWFEPSAADSQLWLIGLAQATEFRPARRFANMVCSNLINLPDFELPRGIEIRAAKPEHLRLIWSAEREAFLQNWGQTVQDESEFEHFRTDPNWELDLWQIAWDGDQVVGAVLNFVNHDENEKYNYKRGYTENIIVRQPWRKRGIARALVVKSMRMFREMGFEQTALGVDTENATGAFQLYQKLGYEAVRFTTMYRKQITHH